MTTIPLDGLLGERTRKLIKFKARSLARRRDFATCDREDIEQELWLAVCARIARFDPSKSSLDTFVDLLVNKAVIALVRARGRLKCKYRPLSVDVINSVESESANTSGVTYEDLARRVGWRSLEADQLKEASQALHAAMQAMTDDQRDLCKRLMTGTITSVAREMNRSRRSLLRSLQEVQTVLEKFGLEKFKKSGHLENGKRT